MSVLETAVADLADALDSLETKIGDRLSYADTGSESAVTTQRHVRSARKNTDAAASELSAIINELKSLIGDKPANS